jgi:hypothetical protein
MNLAYKEALKEGLFLKEKALEGVLLLAENISELSSFEPATKL